jgi:predicted O-methyltransferase YrrM
MTLASARRRAIDLYRWIAPWRRYQRRVRRHADERPALARVLAVDGLLSDAECTLLHDLAAGAAGGCIVEIGTYHGRSTVALALGSLAGARVPVYAIDPFVAQRGVLGQEYRPDDKTRLLENLLLADVVEHVWLLQTTSEQAARGWTEPIALLWVDGDHSDEGVRTDLRCWTPFVVAGGLVALDDSLDPRAGVHGAIAELLAGGGYQRTDVVGKVTVLRKLPVGQ